jgi:F0F1-type ATP synthase membrane subunit c/vacuolar-type H+-ATPase subunit K
MELIAALVYFGGIALCIVLGAGGVALGQGYAGGVACEGTSRQGLAQQPVRQGLLVGCAFLESGCVFSLIVALVYLLSGSAAGTTAGALVFGVAALCMGVVAGVVGAASGTVVAQALGGMARQPHEAGKIFSLMMIAQMLLEAPMVFMFIIAFLIKGWVTVDISLLYAAQLMGGSVIFAAGCIGPAIGQARFCRAVCQAAGLNIGLFSRLFSFSFIVQAMIETPVIFALLVSLMMMLMTPVATVPLVEFASVCLGVVCGIGMGSAGAAIGSGRAAARAALSMAAVAEQASSVARLAIFCQAIIDTAVIYSLIISVLLIKQYM